MPSWIAEERLRAMRASGEFFEVRVRLGQPYAVASDEWACTVAVEGLHGKLHDIHGTSSLQALCLAASLARQLLTQFVEDGGALYSDRDSVEFNIPTCFSCVGNRNPDGSPRPATRSVR